MKKFETFLERVKDEHQDDTGFVEIQDIVSRYRVLESNNKNLHNDQNNLTQQLETKTQDLNQYQKLMETEKITINNKLSMQQQMIEEIENEKAILKGEQTENAAVKTQ